MLRCLRAASVSLVFLTGAAQAKLETFSLDPVHTRVAFRIDHAGLSHAIGTFSGATGELRFDPDDLPSASVDVTVSLASLEIGDAAWRSKVLGRSFLDADDRPVARFVSTRVEPGDAGKLRVLGQLTLRGVTRELALDVHLNALKRHPLTLRRTAGFSATGTLQRSDFGMDAWRSMVGDTVELTIEVEATRAGTTRPSPTPESTDADQEPR